MILIDLDERLIALNDEANQGAACSPWEDNKWRPISSDFARRAWADGAKITKAQALRRYPKADLEAIPALA